MFIRKPNVKRKLNYCINSVNCSTDCSTFNGNVKNGEKTINKQKQSERDIKKSSTNRKQKVSSFVFHFTASVHYAYCGGAQ